MIYGQSKEFMSWLESEKNPNEFYGMTPHYDSRELLHFDCSFESGNLDVVVQKGKHEYDVYPRTDANTRGHNHWFYFTVKTPWHPDRIKKYKDYSYFDERDKFDESKPMRVTFNIFKSLESKGMRI